MNVRRDMAESDFMLKTISLPEAARELLRPDCLDNSDIPDVPAIGSADVGPLDFHPVFRVRQIPSTIEDEKGPLDLLSGGQFWGAAHRELFVQALIKRKYLIKRITGCVHLRLFAR